MDGQVVIAILAALGGASAIGGAIAKIISTVRSWREGVRQREDQADERLVKRLEKKIEILEIKDAANTRYIRRLVMALGKAGIDIPAHPDDEVPSQPS